VSVELSVVTATALVKGAIKPLQEKLKREKINIITKRVIFFMGILLYFSDLTCLANILSFVIQNLTQYIQRQS
jgi:hypothetical protein